MAGFLNDMDSLESFLIPGAMRLDMNHPVCEGKFSNE